MAVDLKIPPTLQDEATFQSIVERAHELNEQQAKGDALLFMDSLRQALAQAKLTTASPQTAQAYHDVLIYLQFVSFTLLSEQEQTELLRHQLILGLTTDIDLKTKLEILFLLVPDELNRRDQLVRALTENTEILGTHTLNTQEESGSMEPIVANWIIDFLRHAPADRPPTALEIASYLNTSSNAKRLSADERALLEQIISLYAFLVNPPYLAVPTGHSELTVRPAPADNAPTDFRTALLQTLFEESQSEEAVFAEEQRLMSGGKYDRARIHDALWSGRANGQRALVEAALFLMARAGELAQLLSRDTTAQQLIETEILPAVLPSLKAQRDTVTLDQLVADYRRAPGRPVYLKLFLEYVLHQVHQGEADAAARAGMRLSDLLFHQGFSEAGGLAYYDADSGQYRWVATGLDSQGVPVLSDV